MLFFIAFLASLHLVHGQRNANYNVSAGSFINFYYQQFDVPTSRNNLKSNYDLLNSTLSLNGEVIIGANSIIDRLNLLPKFNQRVHINIDNQPTVNGGSISVIFGRAKLDNGTVVFMSDMIMLAPRGTSSYIQNQSIRFVSGITFATAVANTRFVFSALKSNPVVTGGATTVGLKFVG